MGIQFEEAVIVLLVTLIVVLIAHWSRRRKVRVWTWLGVVVFYLVSLSVSPELREGFCEVLFAIGFVILLVIGLLVAIPLLLFSVGCILGAPTIKGGKPPDFL